MAQQFRRGILIVAALAAAASLSGCASMRAWGAPKAVYQIDDSTRARALLRNVANHLSAEPATRIVVVSLADGVNFLLEDSKDKNGNPYNIQVEELSAKGVIFDVCEITIKAFNLKKDQFIPEARFVPSGVAEIARLQYRQGYAYVKP